MPDELVEINSESLVLDSSNRLLARARKVDALISTRPGLFFGTATRIGGYPLFVERASGAYLWDVDGNRFTDMLLGYGSVILGHGHPAVEAAAAEVHANLGANPTLLSRHQIDLAERIVELCPGIEMVTFLKTGSDATNAAVRLARAITGRQKILKWGMTGWHDWCAPVNDGVPGATRGLTIEFPYNDLEAVEKLFQASGSDIACLIMMPYEIDAPREGYLSSLKDLCHSHGALFILDEIRSGFRCNIGGAQKEYGVEADLVTFGKAIANGHPISVLGGKRRYMDEILRVGMTVTYFRTPGSMAAAVATLDELVENEVPKVLSDFGQRLTRGLDKAARDEGIDAISCGPNASPWLAFQCDSQAQSERAMSVFCNLMLEQKILLPSNHHWFLSAALTEADLTDIVCKAKSAFSEMRELGFGKT